MFAQWDGVDRGALAGSAVSDIVARGRNDLAVPAEALVPEIGDLLAALCDGGAVHAKMSGSGATCFALYGSDYARDSAARALGEIEPSYWTMACRLA